MGGGAEVSLEPTESWLPLAQNNPYTTEAHLRVTCSEPLHYKIENNHFLGFLAVRVLDANEALPVDGT